MNQRSMVRMWGIVCFVLVVSILGTSLVSAQARKASLKELTETSHAVVTGKCEKKESYWNEGKTKIFTKVTIRTEESIKGNVTTQTVVTVPGGQVGNTIYEVSDMPVFVEGEEVLVFLWNHPSGQTLVAGGLQGKLNIVEEKATGKKLVQGGMFLMQEEQPSKTPGLQKAGTEKVEEEKVYLDDMKTNIRSFVK